MVTTYHAQTNGLNKRRNQIIKIALRYHIFKRPTSPWINYVVTLQWQFNYAYYEITNNTPYKIMFGTKLRGPVKYLVGPKAE